MKHASDKAEAKSREQILAEREAKKLAKQAKRQGEKEETKIVDVPAVEEVKPQTSEKSKAELRAERRAKQEAQRAKKSEVVPEPKIEKKVEVVEKLSPKPKKVVKIDTGVKLFAHLYIQKDSKYIELN